MKCWYRWLISQDLWIKGADVTDVGIRHRDSEHRAEVLNPHKYKCILSSVSNKGTIKRIKTIDKIIAECVAL